MRCACARHPHGEGMYALDTDTSEVAISGLPHREQDWNGGTVLRPIAYDSKVWSDTEIKKNAPKVEMFAVVTFVENHRAYLVSAPFELRVENRTLSWLKTYSMDQKYIVRWIAGWMATTILLSTGCVTSTRMLTASARNMYFVQNWSRSKSTRRKSRKGSCFQTKRFTIWMDKSGYPIPGHPE